MIVKTLAPQLAYLEEAHETLELTYSQIAGALGANESTLHRWRAGESEPRAVFISRMEALHELQTELLDAMEPAAAREWLYRQVPSLDGRRPADLIAEGRIEPVVRVLMRLNLGTPG
ncbi:MAG TPA: antitoxin Xre/MbcA/ParS toxin-binding domain-containing protein [Longimicrobium sp.]